MNVDWEQPTCRYLHLPRQIMWMSVTEWYILIIVYFIGLKIHVIAWGLIPIAPFVIFPKTRKLPRGFMTHFFLLLGLKSLYGYPPPTCGRFSE